MTYHEYKSEMISKLEKITDNSTFEVETILMHITGKKKYQLLADRKKIIDEETIEKLNNAFARRLNREPLQYIIGEWEFFGLRMFCGNGCLIPRPETELLAETVIKTIPRNGLLLDLCTGSGCISVSVLNNRPDVTAVAVDISEKALTYAKKNASYHGISQDRLRFVCADIYNYTPDFFPDMIVSNPPYIKSDDINSLSPEVLYEPVLALDGGHDGLEYYKLIAKYFAKKFLKPQGYCAVEMGYDISREVEAIFKAQKFDTTIIRDFFEVERICLSKNVN